MHLHHNAEEVVPCTTTANTGQPQNLFFLFKFKKIVVTNPSPPRENQWRLPIKRWGYGHWAENPCIPGMVRVVCAVSMIGTKRVVRVVLVIGMERAV
jgi:hypothetical protein